MPDITGEALDRVCTVEARNRGMPHGILPALYDAARAHGGGRPISMVAAEGLMKNVGKGDVVLVLTGAGYPPHMPQGESDGPPGAAAIARAVYRGLGAVPVYVLEEMHAAPVVASSQALGVMVRSTSEARRFSLGAGIEFAPEDQASADAWAEKLLSELQPKAIVSAERLGPGRDGKLYSATGYTFGFPDEPNRIVSIDISTLVDKARERGVFTIGIGDHGNEIGFGAIYDTVAKTLPRGELLATVTATDVIFPVMMSNWGCYAIEAALAFLLKSPELMHTPRLEERQLYACLNAGGLEAIHCTMDFLVDGLDGETSMACVQFLNNIVRKNLEAATSGVAH